MCVGADGLMNVSRRISYVNLSFLQQFDDLNNAAKVLRNSHEFQVLLRIVVVYINFVLGDFNAETVRGCRASALMEVGLSVFQFISLFPAWSLLLHLLETTKFQTTKFEGFNQSGDFLKLFNINISALFFLVLLNFNVLQMCSVELSQTPKTTMLSVVAATVSKQFPDVAKFRETLPALEKAARGLFQSFSRIFCKNFMCSCVSIFPVFHFYKTDLLSSGCCF